MPRIVVIDCMGYVNVWELQKLGNFCRHCLGVGQCVGKCIYYGRCRACLVQFSEMENKGGRHFCVEGMESISKSSIDEVKETCELKPQRLLPRGKSWLIRLTPLEPKPGGWPRSKRHLLPTRKSDRLFLDDSFF